MIEIEVINECGLDAALNGIGYSYGLTSDKLAEFPDPMYDRLLGIAKKLANKPDGSVAEAESKFLRMMVVYARIKAPTYWWIQYDTYKVGTVAQSESKMHTLMKNPITKAMFAGNISPIITEALEESRQKGEWDFVLNYLPISFLQQRIVMLNYAVLRTIFKQRKGHKLKEWAEFMEQFKVQVMYPELLEQRHE